MKVYIVNYGPHMNEAIEKLKMNYPLIILTEGNVNIFATNRLIYDIKKILKDTEVEDMDYLLLGGNTVINSIASVLVYELTGKVNFFIYDAKNKVYVKRENVMVKNKEGSGVK